MSKSGRCLRLKHALWQAGDGGEWDNRVCTVTTRHPAHTHTHTHTDTFIHAIHINILSHTHTVCMIGDTHMHIDMHLHTRYVLHAHTYT